MVKKKERVFAFIDSQNLNLGVRSQGWKLDWRKFRQYLRNKYNATNAYLFVGYKPGNEALYTGLQQMGYIVIMKPTMELPGGIVKGNVDAELVLHTMIRYKKFDKAIIVSGDGDFYCLVEYLVNKGKMLYLLAPNSHYSKLYKPFSKYVIQVGWLKGSLKMSQKKTGISGRSKP
jgi:uncharacterized LabA/DUF88 family protein